MTDTNTAKQVELVTLTVDDVEIKVPKGTNLIRAAKFSGVDVPYYCYHPDLSVPGNCRMCQLEVEGAPKLQIGCATQVAEGMKVRTQATSQKVKDAQSSTLEFILINHPLDCTVCDQAGHCKLQDYHYDYNAKPSQFVEHKEHKVKAQPLGPNVILDGERCIMCTRCIRFCDEVTKTSELGMLNRGDRSVIAINPGKELNNELSGTVVDLCPVGALTHRKWRFNTRIWYTKQTESICPGCSTGCNVKVAIRDGQVVQVKAKANEHVNKEWLCDEGRYGFERFLPKNRISLTTSKATDFSKQPNTLEEISKVLKKFKEKRVVVFVAPDLLLEEYYVLKIFIEQICPNAKVALAYTERELNSVQKVLVSPDYAANFQGAVYSKLVDQNLAKNYSDTVQALYADQFDALLCVGERSIDFAHLCPDLYAKISHLEHSVGILCDADSGLAQSIQHVIGGRSVLEKSGLMINRGMRLQYANRVIDPVQGTEPEWRILNRLAALLGKEIVKAREDRELTLAYLATQSALANLTIKEIKNSGVSIAV